MAAAKLKIGDDVRYNFPDTDGKMDSFPAVVTRVRLDGKIDMLVMPDHPTNKNRFDPQGSLGKSFEVTGCAEVDPSDPKRGAAEGCGEVVPDTQQETTRKEGTEQ